MSGRHGYAPVVRTGAPLKYSPQGIVCTHY